MKKICDYAWPPYFDSYIEFIFGFFNTYDRLVALKMLKYIFKYLSKTVISGVQTFWKGRMI